MEKAEERFKRWTKPEFVTENARLRQQLIVLERQVKHPTFTSFDRGLLVVLASRLPNWKRALLKWHRRGFKLFWRHKSRGQLASLGLTRKRSP